jgi:hypothetical protein
MKSIRLISVTFALVACAFTASADPKKPLKDYQLQNALDANGQAITNLPAPSGDNDSARKSYVDTGLSGKQPAINFAGRNVIYVDPSAAAATDDRTGLSPFDDTKPFATIDAAVAASNGLTVCIIHLAVGDYNLSAVPSAGVTFVGSGSPPNQYLNPYTPLTSRIAITSIDVAAALYSSVFKNLVLNIDVEGFTYSYAPISLYAEQCDISITTIPAASDTTALAGVDYNLNCYGCGINTINSQGGQGLGVAGGVGGEVSISGANNFWSTNTAYPLIQSIGGADDVSSNGGDGGGIYASNITGGNESNAAIQSMTGNGPNFASTSVYTTLANVSAFSVSGGAFLMSYASVTGYLTGSGDVIANNSYAGAIGISGTVTDVGGNGGALATP